MDLFIVAAVIMVVFIPLTLSIIVMRKGHSPRKALKINLLTFLVLAALCAIIPFAASAAGTEDPAPTTAAQDNAAPVDSGADMAKYIAAALAVGLAGIGGGIAVAAAAPAAIGATSENDKSFGKSIIFVALGEGIAIYGLVVSILILFV